MADAVAGDHRDCGLFRLRCSWRTPAASRRQRRFHRRGDRSGPDQDGQNLRGGRVPRPGIVSERHAHLAQGHILTVLSHALDTDYISVTLSDGRKFEAKLLGADPRLDVAVLKIEAAGLPHFELRDAATAQAGARVLALSNLFGVAMGNEPASVQHGTVSVVTRLDARRGVFETPYHGPVYVLDLVSNNPGAAGGAW